MAVQGNKIKKRKAFKLKKNKISFDKEVITKENAHEIVQTAVKSKPSEKLNSETPEFIKPKNKRKKKDKTENTNLRRDLEKGKSAKEESNIEQAKSETFADEEFQSEEETENTNDLPSEANIQACAKSGESKRSLKRKRHAQLLQEKQLKSELVNQQRCLNYLSLWKHNRAEWKFEKLRQVWLQHNMYDIDKVPDEFFEILVQYFCNARGKVKELIISEAVKLIESEESKDTTSMDESERTLANKKLERARTIVQSLEE